MKLSLERLRIIAKNIKGTRINRNLTQEKVAEMAGISPVYYSQIELGNKSPSLETLINLAEAMNVSTDPLIFGKTEDSRWHDLLRQLRACDTENVEKVSKVLYTLIETFALDKQ
jgi:transcriptional regulator with XRE-family HTH domain